MRRMRGWLALCLVGSVLAGCVGGGDNGSPRELKTSSDQTAAEKRSSIRMQLAVGYYQQGNYPVALDEIKQAIAADPESAEAHGVRALIYTSMGETALAQENYQRALRLAPRNAELNNNYGAFLCQTGQHAAGLAQFDMALKNPTYQSPVKALVNAGNCSLKTKNYAAAERYLLDALRYEPDLAATHANLARVYYERRDYTRAGFFIHRLTTLAKPETLSAEVLWLAARIERKLGDKALETSMLTQLRRHHAGSPEFAAWQRGAFDE